MSGDDLSAATDNLLFIDIENERALLGISNSEGGQHAVLVNVSDGSVLRSFENELAAGLTSAKFVDADTILSATADAGLILWSSDDGHLIREIGRASSALLEVDYNAAGNSVMGMADDGRLTLWRLRDRWGQVPRTLSGATSGTGISPSGDLLLLVRDEGAALQKTESEAVILQLESRLVTHAGAVFAALAGDTIGVYDAETGSEIHNWRGDWDDVRELALAPDGELLLLTSGESLLLLRAGTEEPLSLAIGAPSAVAFDPTGARILTVHGERAVLWDAESGEALGAYPFGDVAAATVQAGFDHAGEALHFFLRLESGLAGLTTVALEDMQCSDIPFLT